MNRLQKLARPAFESAGACRQADRTNEDAMNETSERRLLSEEREQLMLQALGDGARTIGELSQEFGVSEATVRRDLQSLENQGKARRVHGGAIRVQFPRTEPIFAEKASLHDREKQMIARRALDCIDNNDTIYLDGGSTILALARMLTARQGLTIVTNSIMAAAELMESGHHLILLGGEFRALSRTLVGPLTAKIVSSLYIDKAFMGTIGFTVEDGVSTTDANEAYTKELIMRRAKRVFVLMDSSKFGVPSLVVSGTLKDIDTIITDNAVSSQLVRQLKKNKIELISSG